LLGLGLSEFGLTRLVWAQCTGMLMIGGMRQLRVDQSLR
jgi:hypothetical protein